MSNGFVKVTLIGNLGKDPELKHTNGGTPVCNLSIACTKKKKDKEGKYVDKTEWVKGTCFGKTAENVSSFCSKGKQIYAEGEMETREWTDKDGNKRYSTEVIIFQVLFLGSKKEGDAKGSSSSTTSSRSSPSSSTTGQPDPRDSAAPPSSNDEVPPITDDDIPF